jgi:hypothetical protein
LQSIKTLQQIEDLLFGCPSHLHQPFFKKIFYIPKLAYLKELNIGERRNVALTTLAVIARGSEDCGRHQYNYNFLSLYGSAALWTLAAFSVS